VWFYDDQLFQSFVDAVQAVVPRWRYSGEVDLLLAPWGGWTTTSYGKEVPCPEFSEAVELRLAHAQASGAIFSVASFLTELVNSGNSAQTFGRRMAAQEWSGAIIDTILSVLPVDLKPLVTQKRILRRIA
jgi:hypothetical protein